MLWLTTMSLDRTMCFNSCNDVESAQARAIAAPILVT